jgi:hypothetical protein
MPSETVATEQAEPFDLAQMTAHQGLGQVAVTQDSATFKPFCSHY